MFHHEVHEGHKVQQKIFFLFQNNFDFYFVYLVNFVVKNILRIFGF